jgi:transposase-like protein
MSKPPKKRSSEYKLQLVLESLKGDKNIAQLASEHEMHPRQILRWKDKLLSEADNIFKDQRTQQQTDPDKEKLLMIIDQLTLELEFLKKKLRRND